MNANLILHGRSPELPLDLTIQLLAQAKFTGSLRAVTTANARYRVFFREGRIACALGPERVDETENIRRLLALRTVWGVEPHENVPARVDLDVQAVLMEVARKNDEHERTVRRLLAEAEAETERLSREGWTQVDFANALADMVREPEAGRCGC